MTMAWDDLKSSGDGFGRGREREGVERIRRDRKKIK